MDLDRGEGKGLRGVVACLGKRERDRPDGEHQSGPSAVSNLQSVGRRTDYLNNMGRQGLTQFMVSEPPRYQDWW